MVTELQISSKQCKRFVQGNRTITAVCNKEWQELELQFDSNGVQLVVVGREIKLYINSDVFINWIINQFVSSMLII